MNKDIFTLLGGFLTALLMFFGTIGFSLDWFTAESINAFILVVSTFVALAINAYAVWKNTYVSRKAQQQREVLEENNLIEKRE